MNSIQLSFNFTDNPLLKKRLSLLDEVEMDLAEKAALNKTAKWVNTRLRRGISQRTKIMQKYLKSRIRTSFSTGQHRIRSAFLWVGENDMDAYQTGTAKQTAGGVKVGKNTFDRAFIIKGDNHFHDGVFVRLRMSRYPIKRQWIEIQQASQQTIDDLRNKIPSRLVLELERQIDYRLSK